MSNIAKKDEDFVDSDASDGEDTDIDPKIAKLSTHELMQRMFMKIDKMENKRIPKLKKTIKNIEANQVELNTKLEDMEDRIQENKAKTDENEEKIEKMNEEVMQMKKNQVRNENEIKALTDEVNKNAEEQLENKNKLKEMEKQFRMKRDLKIRKLQEEINDLNEKE